MNIQKNKNFQKKVDKKTQKNIIKNIKIRTKNSIQGLVDKCNKEFSIITYRTKVTLLFSPEYDIVYVLSYILTYKYIKDRLEYNKGRRVSIK